MKIIMRLQYIVRWLTEEKQEPEEPESKEHKKGDKEECKEKHRKELDTFKKQ